VEALDHLSHPRLYVPLPHEVKGSSTGEEAAGSKTGEGSLGSVASHLDQSRRRIYGAPPREGSQNVII